MAEAATRADAGVLLSVDHLFRHRAGQMVATLTRIFGLEQIDLVEDVVQDAFVQALRRWPYSGVPDNPNAWLIQVAKNRALDVLRRRGNWREKQAELRRGALPGVEPEADAAFALEIRDDQLRMIFACCHPAISRDAQVAVTLKTVGGFSVPELARAFLTRRAAMAQRLLRAKQRLRESAAHFEMPAPGALPEQLDAALEVLYLMFNEGYSPLEGEAPVRPELCQEAIRLAELLCDHPLTAEPRSHALAALLLLQGSRVAARDAAGGELVLLGEQDRSLWDRGLIRRGIAHMQRAARGDALSAYHFEAEIAACHALAESWAQTDWPRILDCYDGLLRVNPSPIVALNRVVALAEVAGSERGLEELALLESHRELKSYYPFFATRGELLRRTGRAGEAREAYRRVLALTTSEPVRRFCQRRLAEPG